MGGCDFKHIRPGAGKSPRLDGKGELAAPPARDRTGRAMSSAGLHWARRQRPGGAAAKLVLLLMADSADSEGVGSEAALRDVRHQAEMAAASFAKVLRKLEKLRLAVALGSGGYLIGSAAKKGSLPSKAPPPCTITEFAADGLVVTSAGDRIGSAQLFDAYAAFCRAQGRPAVDQATFHRRFPAVAQSLGIGKGKASRIEYRGARLKAAPPPSRTRRRSREAGEASLPLWEPSGVRGGDS